MSGNHEGSHDRMTLRGLGAAGRSSEMSGPLVPPGPRARAILGFCLLLTLAGLVVHGLEYAFLTDDAFISFRYARNLARGFGLVFNPGHERVEGYSNFLYVLMLAAFDRAGVAPEHMAHVVSWGATLALWSLVAWFSFRRTVPDPRQAWVGVLPVALLAITRSVAVWSTSGLETRLFEALIVGAAFRLIVEIEADLEGRPRRAVAGWLFALATWTRPDGLLLSACALGAAGLVRIRRGRFDARRLALDVGPYVVLVGGHFLWRRAYYGFWLPNTYYAKVGGRLWWSSGIDYLTTFALEYAFVLWLPLVALGVFHHLRRGRGFVAGIPAAMVLPHALYIASIGGDHFEYRPLDLYFPFCYVLLADGVREALARHRVRAASMAAYLLLVACGIWELAWQSHRQFPRRYLPGFPGVRKEVVEAYQYLDPERSWLYRWPGLRALARLHRDRLRDSSRRFVGLRQEEHAMFLATVIPTGLVLRQAIDRGLIPADIHVALPCVGAIPYYSDVRTLDILGLTDAKIAHAQVFRSKRAMAHDKEVKPLYGLERGVDLWAVASVHPVIPLRSEAMRAMARLDAHNPMRECSQHAAAIQDGYFLVGCLPQGFAKTERRMPRLQFRSLSDPQFLAYVLAEGMSDSRERLARNPDDHAARLELAGALLEHERLAEADQEFRKLAQVMPDSPDVWAQWARCRERVGDYSGAVQALDRALALIAELEDSEWLDRWRSWRVRLEEAHTREPG